MSQSLLGMELAEIREALGPGHPQFRAKQIYTALYRQKVGDLAQISTLPAGLRQELAGRHRIGLPKIAQRYESVDGTRRYLLRLEDARTVETVLMPEGERDTICISSQVGCAVNCQFCLTAKLGIRRNLTAGEIAGQVAAVRNRHAIQIGKDRINLVFMGMGEPFLNYDAFMKSVRVLVGMGISEMRMTVSTSGILPGIEAFARETEMRPKLALSLNASNDGVREQIMPITRKWNIAALLEAVGRIPLRTREWVTFEYVLLGGVNDQPEHAREVLALLSGMRAKVNLIVWNPGPGIEYHQPRPEDVVVFQKMLIAGGMPTYIRRPRGRDIYAACGQLKRTVSEDAGLVTIGA